MRNKMAELRKRGAGLSLSSQDLEESDAISSSSGKPGNKTSIPWIFLAIVVLYWSSFYISYKASRIVPTPKTAAGSSRSEFAEENARKHLEAITSFGARPTGSYANEVQAVNYILNALQSIKRSAREDVIFEIDVQKPSGAFTLDFFEGFTSVYRNITNILVRVTPKQHHPPKHAVLMNGHFDSIPGGPGASDDAVSCAVMLEIIRSLVQTRQFRFLHGVVFNFNGAEENVLQASHGFITQHEWVATIRAFVNLEAAGAGGKEIVFQAGPNHPWLIKTYAEVAPYPCAQAIAQEVFQSGLIPSDTDFRIYRDFGNIPGIDIAYSANGYVYHTNYDTPAAVTPGSIQRAGDNILTLLKTILNSPYLADPGEYCHGAMVFFDILGAFIIHYPERIGFIINSVTVFVVVLCFLSKFARFPAKKKDQESDLAMTSISISGLITSLIVLMLSWVAGLVVPQLLAVLLTYTGHSLTWYCRPYILLPLYAVPAMYSIGLVHFLVRKSLVCKITAVEKKEKSAEMLGHKINTMLSTRESESFYASLLVWTIILSVMTYNRLASAHLPLLWVAFPLVSRALLWEKLFKTQAVHSSQGQFVAMYLTSIIVPIQLSTYLTISILDVFVPIMGRGGTQVVPDVFICLLCSFSVVMLTSYMVSLVYVMDCFKFPAAILLGSCIVALVASLSGLSFPYSAVNQCPKRIFTQHTSRTFYDNEGTVFKSDAGVWITPLDYLGIQPLSHVAEFQQAKPAPDEGVYGGFPYYLPLRHLMRRSWYLPAPPPHIQTSPLEVRLLSRKQDGRTFTFKFSISGPDHMTVYLSPVTKVGLVQSSLGQLYPIEETGVDGRLTYFIYYSHGTDVGPWVLSFALAAREDLPSKVTLLDFAVAGHYIHDKQSSSPELEEILKVTPEWVFSNSWVNMYKSWSFTT